MRETAQAMSDYGTSLEVPAKEVIQQVPETFEQQVLNQGLPAKEAIPQVDAGFLDPIDDFFSNLFGSGESNEPEKEVAAMVPKEPKNIFTSFWDAMTGD
jgi:hypothetical protein